MVDAARDELPAGAARQTTIYRFAKGPQKGKGRAEKRTLFELFDHRTDLAYSVGVMPNFSLNWREK